MFDPATAALLRAVLDEVCANIPQLETSTRTRVASKILEAATKGECSVEDLKEAGREALDDAYKAASREGWRRSEAREWKATETEGWPE